MTIWGRNSSRILLKKYLVFFLWALKMGEELADYYTIGTKDKDAESEK